MVCVALNQALALVVGTGLPWCQVRCYASKGSIAEVEKQMWTICHAELVSRPLLCLTIAISCIRNSCIGNSCIGNCKMVCCHTDAEADKAEE